MRVFTTVFSRNWTEPYDHRWTWGQMTSIASVYAHNDTAKTRKNKLPRIFLLSRAAEEPVIKALKLRANTALWTYSVLVLFCKTNSKSIKLICWRPRHLVPGEVQLLPISLMKCFQEIASPILGVTYNLLFNRVIFSSKKKQVICATIHNYNTCVLFYWTPPDKQV